MDSSHRVLNEASTGIARDVPFRMGDEDVKLIQAGFPIGSAA